MSGQLTAKRAGQPHWEGAYLLCTNLPAGATLSAFKM